jgi:hypothetical protein
MLCNVPYILTFGDELYNFYNVAVKENIESYILFIVDEICLIGRVSPQNSAINVRVNWLCCDCSFLFIALPRMPIIIEKMGLLFLNDKVND